MKNALSVICLLMMAWFMIPVFTGRILNIGNLSGFLLFFLLFLLLRTSLTRIIPSFFRKAGIILLILIAVTAGAAVAGMIRACSMLPQGNETMIILGCGLYGEKPSRMLIKRLETASEWLKEHPDAPVIVSGGKGDGEDISEAQAMKNWLEQYGTSNPVFVEDSSRNTDENIRFSAEIIRKENLSSSVVIATDGFHEYRASLLCRKYALSFHACPAKTAWWLLPTFYTRELFAIIKTWISMFLT